MRTHLVIANQTLGGPELSRVLAARCAAEPSSFHVVVPATRRPGLFDRIIDAYAGEPDEEELGAAHRSASLQLDREVQRIRMMGATVDGEVGDPDPLTAVRDLLSRRSFDEIILSTLPAGASRWIGMDLPRQLARLVGHPITHVAGPRAEVP